MIRINQKIYNSLADNASRYAKASSKKSILETKPLSKGFKIKPSELGYEYEKGKYIFATENATKEYAKNRCMESLRRPLEEQFERAAIIEGRKIVSICDGNNKMVNLRGYDLNKEAVYDMFHTHPSIDSSKTALPLSNHIGDLLSLFTIKPFKSHTALNELGEYNTAEIVDLVKFREDLVPKGPFYDLKSVVSSKFFNSLKEACEKKGITNALSAKNPQEYAKLLHEVYKENLHKFGLKYTTNFSNLV